MPLQMNASSEVTYGTVTFAASNTHTLKAVLSYVLTYTKFIRHKQNQAKRTDIRHYSQTYRAKTTITITE